MVRPSQERSTRALTDAQSTSIGTGTDVGDDGMDYDGGGTNPDASPVTPPGAEPVEVIADSSTWDGVLDFNDASWWDITLTDDLTITGITNAPPAGLVGLLTIIFRQGGAGSFTVTWPAEVEWPDTDGTDGGSPPTLHTAVDARDVIQLITEDGGTSYGGSYDGGSTGGSALTIDDEGTPLTTAATSIDFVGAGVTATAVGDDVTVTIPAGPDELEELTDVDLTSPHEDDTLRYVGAIWINDNRRWEPVTDNPGGGPEIVFDGDDIVMEWMEY